MKVDVRTPFSLMLLSIASIPNNNFPSIHFETINVNLMQLISCIGGVALIYFTIKERQATTRAKDYELKRMKDADAEAKKEKELKAAKRTPRL